MIVHSHSPRRTGELDAFRDLYNEQRPHRAIGRRTPAAAYAALPRAHPSGRGSPGHFRLRYDTTDSKGALTLRRGGRMHDLRSAPPTPARGSWSSSTSGR